MTSEIEHCEAIRGVAGIDTDPKGADPFSDRAATKLIYLIKGPGFGSGKHPTTQACLSLLQPLLHRYRPQRVLDAGAGNAILSIAAAFLGARKILAVEIDSEAADTARTNVRINGVRGRVYVYWGDAFDLHDTYDLIMANLSAQQAALFASKLESRLMPGGYMLLSGLCGFERERALEKLAIRKGLILLDEIFDGGWTTMLLHKAA